jgi:hypothetical protein
MELSTRYTVVSALIDQANAADGVAVDYRGECYPKEVLYAQRHLAWVLRLQPDAGECLRIAAQTQHICRWEIPRADYPMNRSGYLKWREALKYFHAERAGLLMAEAGYDAESIQRVQSLNLKKQLRSDVDCQTLEDALCLTFLELGLDALIAKHEEPKLLGILRKTAAKMSEAGRQLIETILFSPQGQRLLAQL